MNLNIRIKFRAGGITFGSLSGTVPLRDFLQKLAAVLRVPPDLANFLNGTTGVTSSKTLYDDHGVSIVLAP